MGLTVYWTWFAESKLEEIFDYYEAKASPQTAQKLVLELIEATLALEQTPRMGQKEELLADRPEDFRYLVCNNYKLIYWIDDLHERVVIAHVFDCRQNPTTMKEFD